MATDWRAEEMCPHGEQTPADCKVCEGRLPDRKISETVYITAGGVYWHRKANCHILEFGQSKVLERGGNPAPIEAVSLDSVKYDREPCHVCGR